ncbi:MAG: HAD-IA family hydrolase [Gemmatimonadetes bacterium]|nr:HAD-IA family hydrolase [Gemmatimonadota bacterium]
MTPTVVLFDLLTALLDSWTVWNAAAGSEEAGRRWRAAYLRLTYGSGWYRPYETLVREAALATGLDVGAAVRLERAWDTLPPWEDAARALEALAGHVKLGVVTNCSTALGARAAARLDVPWDVIVTAEDAGFYKPHPAPYRMALERLGASADEARFVAGSGYDLIGTQAVGLRTYWHNRVGLARPEGAPAAELESSTLAALPAWVLGAGVVAR